MSVWSGCSALMIFDFNSFNFSADKSLRLFNSYLKINQYLSLYVYIIIYHYTWKMVKRLLIREYLYKYICIICLHSHLANPLSFEKGSNHFSYPFLLIKYRIWTITPFPYPKWFHKLKHWANSFLLLSLIVLIGSLESKVNKKQGECRRTKLQLLSLTVL